MKVARGLAGVLPCTTFHLTIKSHAQAEKSILGAGNRLRFGLQSRPASASKAGTCPASSTRSSKQVRGVEHRF